MSGEPEQRVDGDEGAFSQVSPRQIQVDGQCAGPATMMNYPGDDEGPESLKAKVYYLQLKLEEVQGESSLLKEWGARIEMYVDCLGDALESNNISHVYDVDGSLVSLDECRQKAKTLPHTRKPHCDEDIRTKQYEAEIDTLRQETEALKTDLEDALQRSTEQEYLLEQLQTAEYRANRRWEAYHERVMQQWGKCYSDLQRQHGEAVGRLQNLGTAFNSLKKTTVTRNQAGQFNRADPFRRYRSSPIVRRDVSRPATVVPGQFQRRPMTDAGERMRSVYQSRAYRDRSDYAPVLPRAESAAILTQFFANLDMIHRQQQFAGRRNRRYEPRRQPGPYGEAN